VSHIGGVGEEVIESDWHAIRATFHNFENLPHERGKSVKSEIMECHGLKWQILVWPRGHVQSSRDEIFLAASLCCISSYREGENVMAASRFRIPSTPAVASGMTYPPTLWTSERCTKASPNVVRRSDILDRSQSFLTVGALTVEIDIMVLLDKPTKWMPTNTVCADMLKMLESDDPDDYDVTFQVGDKEPCLFYAHLNVLKVRAPVLAEIAGDSCDSRTTILIENIEPEIFQILLRSIYGGEIPDKNVLTSDVRMIIRAADRFGCTGLKLAAEAEMAAEGIDVDNAAELILLADGANCAMLKEAAMDYFAANAQTVMDSKGFEQVKESPAIMAELMSVALGVNKKRCFASSGADSSRDFKRMRVAALRQKLDDRGLDVDGSKEMLVTRLEEAGGNGMSMFETE